MGRESGRLDYWRSYFDGCNSDIFGVIENAIVVAAMDCPIEFLKKRDAIVEKLFSCRSARCSGCDRIELWVPCGEGEGEELKGRCDQICVGGGGDGEDAEEDGDDDLVGGGQMVSNYSYDEAEALTEEIEEEGQTVGEVLRIKELLTSNEFKSESALFESLRRLQLMGLSVETLKATEIGKIVNGLRKHSNKQIRQLARALIDGWKAMVEEWANSTAVLAEATPESANPSSSMDQWEGLPLPPLDEGALLVTTGMELSQIFDGMDDDGNLRNSGLFDDDVDMDNDDLFRKQQNRASRDHNDRHPVRAWEPQNSHNNRPHSQNTQYRPQCGRPIGSSSENQHRQSKDKNVGSGPVTVKPPRPANDQRVTRDTRPQNHPTSREVQKKAPTSTSDKATIEDNSVRDKLEIAKRKLHEGYRQAETAKRQRTIQVMELHDLPKQSLDNRQLHQRPMNGNRYWANRRV